MAADVLARFHTTYLFYFGWWNLPFYLVGHRHLFHLGA